MFVNQSLEMRVKMRFRLLDCQKTMIAPVGRDEPLEVEQFEGQKDEVRRTETCIGNAPPTFVDQQTKLTIDAERIGCREDKRRLHILLRANHCPRSEAHKSELQSTMRKPYAGIR